jgi:hypothetical protein
MTRIDTRLDNLEKQAACGELLFVTYDDTLYECRSALCPGDRVGYTRAEVDAFEADGFSVVILRVVYGEGENGDPEQMALRKALRVE